ncbi:hypothetical protein BIV60_12305 [Bacillus sp. MUM 116]|uniref:bifunctional adenosylcobinamide kinase/adenosylcobinamide-phosphate guanylyltransferase n=1 Tax=Bacillus sp. MUM 116 TaxID=1678002 RepID=UPI0008F5CFAD|nr:bifunctional adenosylcobinamide kinase/adenosylcobinamide-phosphate guanylyltransferase [Bacillus sp. MUM 116]OIK14153.1 hypothetical protein BIV60_12305 [Bacillus sp. MUM 116]
MANVPSLIFITGGVRSGKSSFAERKGLELAAETGGNLIYFATGVPSDVEMEERISKHQQDRAAGKYQWKTVEQSSDIGLRAVEFTKRDTILLDCVTTLLNNELFATETSWDNSFLESVKERIFNGITKIKEQSKTMIVVSNEVVYEPIHEKELVIIYGRLLGHIHRQLVKDADEAYLVEAGIPIMMKGMKA